MSGFLSSVGKVFKKIVKSPIFKVVAIAAAVYFTGGLALGAMGGEVGAFAASLPGISGAADALGITAGAFGGTAATEAAAAAANAALAQAGLGESIGMTAEEAAAATMGPGLEGAAGAAGGAAADTGSMLADAGTTMSDVGTSPAASAASNAAGSATPTAADATAPLNTQAAPSFDPNDMASGSGVTAQPAPNALGQPGQTTLGKVPANTLGQAPNVTGQSIMNTANPYDNAVFSQGTSSAQTTAEATDSTNPFKSAWQWFKDADPNTQRVLLSGVAEGAKGVLGALGTQQQNAERRYEFDTTNANRSRMGQTFDISAAFKGNYQKPSIINTGVGG